MELRTKGIVQIELDATLTSRQFEVLITPDHSRRISAGGQEFVLFIETSVTSTSAPPNALLLPKDTSFTAAIGLIQSTLIKAASGAVCVELKVDGGKPTEITGIVFPAPNK
jgi:hypothetical protein